MLINANKYQSEQTQDLFALGMSYFFLCQLLYILPEACSHSLKKKIPKMFFLYLKNEKLLSGM